MRDQDCSEGIGVSTLLRRRSSVLLLALVVGSVLALPRLAAWGNQTQAEMNRLAGGDFAKADADLSRAYSRLMKTLDAKAQARLKTSEQAWIKFRDAESVFLASKVEGGSVYPSVYALHKTELTRRRTKELKQALKLFTTEGDF